MILRTAKRGARAGGKFYGCSRYPNCKATVPFEPVLTESGEPEKEKRPLTEAFFPRTLVARTRFQDYQVRFFETAAVPESMIERIYSEDIEEEILKAFSQWRIDFPIRESRTTLNEYQCQMISVLEKILTRGRITIISPQLEKDLKEIFPEALEADPHLSFIESSVFQGYQESQKHSWLDSREENIFYEDILLKFLGENHKQFVLPQVEISSLVPPNFYTDSTSYRRVDFAIFHPLLKDKIIVEIDGDQHKQHVDSDQERDEILQLHGFTVIRIQANEIQNGNGNQLSVLRSKLSSIHGKIDKQLNSSCNEIIKFIHSMKMAQQIQITLLQAIQSGFLNLEDTGSWHIIADIDELSLFDERICFAILKKSAADFIDILGKLSKLYSTKVLTKEPRCDLFSKCTEYKQTNTIFISFSGKLTSDLPTFYIQNIYFPFRIANSSFSTTPAIKGLEKPTEKDLEYFLRYLFRKDCFWEGQYDGIIRALQGKDALLLLPTGAGKSLVYQLSSLLLPGRTVVIDPIISLMEDQIDNLALIGIDRCIAITSQITDAQDRSRAIQLFGQGEYLFAYVAPERFQTVEFRESLRALTVHTPVALIVVDEAHCVSEWGHDFRTSYLNIGRTSRDYCESDEFIPPLLALTGTASRAVLKDIQRELQIEDFDAIITPGSFDRKELKFHIIYSASQEKTARLKGFLGQKLPNLFNTTASTLYEPRGKDTYSGLVFCPHVGGEFGVVKVSDEMKEDLGISSSIYSGKEPKHWDLYEYHKSKRRTTKEFKRNKIPLLVCTKAFGMGIDKSNIRYTIHLGIPPSIESFYQEAGRAGRDRKTAHCCIIVSNDDPERSLKLLNPNTSVEEMDEFVRNLSWEQNDDITRVLYFHTKAFRGLAKEKQEIEEIMRHLGDISQAGTRILSLPSFERNITEKALHRLLIIGVISDYTIDYSNNEFTVKLTGADKEEIIDTYKKYVASFQYRIGENETEKARQLLSLPLPEFITSVVDLLLHFIYSVIERGRRRAINEMLMACAGKDIRKRILRYLEETEYSKILEEIVTDKKAGLIQSMNLFSSVRSTNESAELRGQVSRYLESYPDHPGLLVLRSLSEIFSRDKNNEVAKQNFIASINSGLQIYGLSDVEVSELATWAIKNISSRDLELANEFVDELLKAHHNRDFARAVIRLLPPILGNTPANFLLSQLEQECRSLIIKKGG
jgi:ATP-dependent DNA helicase RecQ